MNISTRLLQWCFLLCVLLLAGGYLVAGAHLFPAFGGDAASHLVPVLNLKTGRGFGGVMWTLTRDYDATGQHRFLQYPPLFHLVVAGLIRQPTAASISLCLAGFAVAALFLYAGLVWRMPVAGAFTPRRRWLALACLSLCAVSTWLYQLPSSGRPEALTTPLLLLAALGITWARPAYRLVIAGIFIGLIGAAQIANACLAGLLFSVYASLQPAAGPRRFRSWLTQVSLTAALSLLVFAACFLFSPHPFLETMRGIAAHLAQIPGSNYSVVSYYIFPANTGTFYGLFLIVLSGHFLWWYRARLDWLGVLNFGAFVCAAWALAVRSPNHCYNLLALTPLLIALALLLLARLDQPAGAAIPPGKRSLIYAGYFGLFALMSVGLARQVALYGVYRQRGVSYEQARTHLRALLPADAPVLVDGGLWPLLDRFDRAYQHSTEGYPDQNPTPGPEKPFLLVHQWYGRLDAPPAIAGYQLIWDDFVRQPSPRVLGIKVGTAMPGYAFALYKPVTAEQ